MKALRIPVEIAKLSKCFDKNLSWNVYFLNVICSFAFEIFIEVLNIFYFLNIFKRM